MRINVVHRLVSETNEPIDIRTLERLKPIVAEVSHVKYLRYDAAPDEALMEVTYVLVKPEGKSYSVGDRARIKKDYRKRVEG